MLLTAEVLEADQRLCDEATEEKHFHHKSDYHPDITLIARSRTALPLYIAEVRRLMAELGACSQALRNANEQVGLLDASGQAADIKRINARLESLQQHIDNLYRSTAAMRPNDD